MTEATLVPENQTKENALEDINKTMTEALDPYVGKDKVVVKSVVTEEEKTIPIRFMPVAREEELFDTAAPLLDVLFELRFGQGFSSSLKTATQVLPKVVAIIGKSVEGLDEDWIRNNLSLADLVDVAIHQLVKFKEQDLLGKFSRLTGQAKKGTGKDTAPPKS